MNYNNGILVGAYYVKGWDDRSLPFTTSGTLTSAGKPTGVWKFETVDKKTEVTFSNGIVLNRPDYDSNLRTKAKAYAAGSISKEKLQKENICVRRDSLMIGKDAWSQILHPGIDWEKLGGWSFEKGESVEYYYLDRLPTLSAEGYEKFKNGVIQYIRVGGDMSDLQNDSYGDDHKIMLCSFYKANNGIGFDNDCDLHCISVHKNDVLSKFCIGYPDWSNYIDQIYFSTEQYNELQKLMHEERLKNLDKTPIADTKFSVSKGYEFQIAEYFKPSEVDHNIIVFHSDNIHNKDNVLYFSRDAFEDYFIKLGYAKTILEISPEERHERINKKNEEHLISLAESWVKDHILNKSHSVLSSAQETSYLADADASLFPIVSYTTLGIEPTNRGYKVKARVNVAVAEKVTLKNLFSLSGTEPASYCTYEADINIIHSRVILSTKSFVKIKNDYDLFAELDAQIKENDEKIKTLSKTSFKPNAAAYKTYKQGVKLTTNHKDLKSSIEDRNKVISVQTRVFEFVDKLKEIQNGDNDISTKCGDKKDIVKNYAAYIKTRDLSWSTDWSLDKLNDYIAVQKKCLEFNDLRTTVQTNNATIDKKKSAAPAIYKAYTTYKSSFDISWNSNIDFANINTLISTQERYLKAISKENISSIDKSIKKQKISDIMKILEMDELK